MVHHFVHEVAIVGHNDNTTPKILKILFQHLQGHNVQIVGRLIQNKKIRLFHEHDAQMQTAALSTRQLIYIVLLLQRCKHEMLQELHRRKLAAAAQIHIFCNSRDGVNHFHPLVKLHILLREIPESHRFAHIEATGIRCLQSEEQLDKR